MTKISAHSGLGELPNKLDELWIEIGGSCHLKCTYCFAESGGIDNDERNIPIKDILAYLGEFKELGGSRIAVVGAGEPFHARNIADLFEVIDHNTDNNIATTIFTTGDLLTDTIIDMLDAHQNLTLLVKYNTSDPEIQDKLVQNQGYTNRRQQALERLMERGYNDGKRLGIVTPVMEGNYDEISDILRFARNNNLIFDADTIIPRGRGGTCGLNPEDQKIKQVLTDLQRIDKEEFGNQWEITSSYVGSPPCTRFNQHLYIDKLGLVHPCVSSADVLLGDAREQSLGEIWNSRLALIIRDHIYVGKCTTCKNFNEESELNKGMKKCYSCLGRSTTDLTTESLERDGCVKTVGCFNYASMK
ncbi:radical SAM protein [Candidatus Woesearchaeota archaeon]|nr:radical SAM protein [Candidatus Woesearchaeota archaeon]MBT5272900.1 radical SAM protein [Candidatus Woesearchaeota archaeon]MBT6041366.1 radical SAM protein [Candidatus Woesearchaeota archaeon]MBT6337249.1 radical SAM protein [Candidatus Woesearchaeota archaeon]MBT7927126.1 radical SAM protein [Candidatus Woesearchaeota archaeon]